MPTTGPTERRERLRAILQGSACISPASVFDPLSALIAESVGHQLAMLSGSVSSRVILGAPDLMLLTLTEFAAQIRLITRTSNLSLMLDADSAYANALNVKRMVEEVEYAGASAVEIEGTEPIRFGDNPRGLVSIEEMSGKLRAAVAARQDPSFVIFGRTAAMRPEGIEGTLLRVSAYRDAGVDGIVLLGAQTLEHIEAVSEAAKLPLVVGGWRNTAGTREDLATRGVRILPQGDLPNAAAIKALQIAYQHLFNGGSRGGEGMVQEFASAQEIADLVDADFYERWQQTYLQ